MGIGLSVKISIQHYNMHINRKNLQISRKNMKLQYSALKNLSIRLRGLMGSFLGLSLSPFALAYNDMPGGPAVRQINFPAPVTKIMEEIHWLHYFMLILCVVIFVAVFGVMFYSILKHRKSLGHK
jgi:cytochrome c oxidase subunit 2